MHGWGNMFEVGFQPFTKAIFAGGMSLNRTAAEADLKPFAAAAGSRKMLCFRLHEKQMPGTVVQMGKALRLEIAE